MFSDFPAFLGRSTIGLLQVGGVIVKRDWLGLTGSHETTRGIVGFFCPVDN